MPARYRLKAGRRRALDGAKSSTVTDKFRSEFRVSEFRVAASGIAKLRLRTFDVPNVERAKSIKLPRLSSVPGRF
jgi:hypothetical protein